MPAAAQPDGTERGDAMRALKEFSRSDWRRLLPLRHALKQARNDLWLAAYCALRPASLAPFLAEAGALAGKNVALVVAFEQPWALDWQLRMAARHLQDATVLVFDNSRRPTARAAIERVCGERGTRYLALPANPTRHVNRSHGMAMTWIFRNVVSVIGPRLFAFLDHDLIPVRDVALAERLGDQPFFGLMNRSENLAAWQLWAGYCLFDFSALAGRPMNFLYDFSRGLDTGGRNWRRLYRNYDRDRLRFADDAVVEVTDPVTGQRVPVQLVDERWLHIGGIGYNDNFSAKSQFCQHLADAFERGMGWDRCLAPAGRDAGPG